MTPLPAPRILLGATLLAAAASPAAILAQTATVLTDENFRNEPQGVRLGVVPAGTRLAAGRSGNGWVEVTLEGWMWTPSLQRTNRLGFDLAVSVDDGENLRETPSGKILARLVEGALLEELGRIEGWVRVRRTGWMWAASLEVTAAAAAAPRAAAPTEERAAWLQGGPRGSAILAGPDGDTLARTSPNTQLRVLGREGNWARVRIEGWTWAPASNDLPEPDSGEVAELAPADVIRTPEVARGRMVSWELQFISVERAERVRTDFFEGEPFLLTRPADGSGGFVYVAVPADRLSSVASLTPLERITVVGRIRTGAAALTGNPIVDLLELHRARAGRPRP